MWIKIYHNQKAFSLVEIMVVIALSSVVAIYAGNYIVTTMKSSTFQSEQGTAVENAQKAINTMIKDVRGANVSNRGDYPILVAEPQEFIFFSDIDDDENFEKIHYFVSSSTLKKAVTEPGALNDYSGLAATTTLTDYLNNQSESIFNYYSSDHSTSTVINQIRLVNINLKINVTPWRAPNDVYVESAVQLRNLKDNL